MFSDLSNFTGWIKEEQNIKVEPISNIEDLYYGNHYSKQYIKAKVRGNIRHNTNNKDSGNQSSYLRKVNKDPCNKDGEITKFVCVYVSIYHWMKSCLDSCQNQMKIKEETNIIQ